MITGIGTPVQGPYLLASVAAVVLGGVSLAGGRGGLVGPIVAVFILRLVRTDLTFLAVDPNVAQSSRASIMVSVVMLGGVVALRSRGHERAPTRPRPAARRGCGRGLAARCCATSRSSRCIVLLLVLVAARSSSSGRASSTSAGSATPSSSRSRWRSWRQARR